MNAPGSFVLQVHERLFAALLSCVCSATVTGEQFTAAIVGQDEIRVSRFDDVVAMVSQGDEFTQERFADIALALLIEAFEAELEPRSTLNAQDRKEHGGWRVGARGYVEQLRRIAESARRGARIEMIQEQHDGVRLVIGREQIMLNAPRPAGQRRFEQTIAENVCRFIDCTNRPATVEERSIARTARLESSWTFAHNAPPSYVSSDGLRCIFDDQRHLKLKKEACIAVMGEVRLLSEALAALHAHHKWIDWDAIQITHVGASTAQKVVYSRRGEFVRMSLPHLLHAESVWRSALPWVKATVLGRPSQHVINLPNQLAYQPSTVKGDYEIN